MRQSIRQGFNDYADAVRPIEHLMTNIQSEAQRALRDRNIRRQHHSIQCGSVVLVSGYLESFLRTTCENYFSELSARGFGMEKLGSDFLEIHLREGAGYLTDLIKRESKREPALTDSSAFVRRLVAPIADRSRSPAWEAFARTQGNPSAAVIKNFLLGLGIRGGLASIEKAIHERYSASTIEQLLRVLIDTRNECAHSGSTQNIPTPSVIKDQVIFTKFLTLGICRLVDRHITEILT